MNLSIQKKLHLVRESLRLEFSKTLQLAAPVIISQFGQMVMGVVDCLMVGKLGPAYIASVGLGTAFFAAISFFGVGLLLGLDYLVASAFGRNDLTECHFWLVQSLYMALIVALPLTLLGYFCSYHFAFFHIAPEVQAQGEAFLRVLVLSMPSFLFFFSFRLYLQAMSKVKFVTLLIIVGNILNAFLDWVFIYGKMGMPEMKAPGAGLATVITRLLLVIALVAYTLYLNKKNSWGLLQMSWKLNLNGVKRMLTLGLPAGLQLVLEVTVFSMATSLAGRLDAQSLAAHAIVLNLASLTFMFPLGLGAATAVRVGQYVGQQKFREAVRTGWLSIFLGIAFMSLSGILLYLFAHPLLKFFTTDFDVITLGTKLLLVAALFQIADGLQTVATGALRGISNTRAAMFANLIGHWSVGLPLMIYLCFHTSLRVLGLWIGMAIGLIAVAIFVLRSWTIESASLESKGALLPNVS